MLLIAVLVNALLLLTTAAQAVRHGGAAHQPKHLEASRERSIGNQRTEAQIDQEVSIVRSLEPDLAKNALSGRDVGDEVAIVNPFLTNVAIGRHSYPMVFSLELDGLITWNAQDKPGAWQPRPGKTTHKGKAVSGINGEKGTEYITDIVWDKNTMLSSISVIVSEAMGEAMNGPDTGIFGLGLGGSGPYPHRDGKVPIEEIGKFGLALDFKYNGKVTIGKNPAATRMNQALTVSSVSPHRWSISGKLNGFDVKSMDFVPAGFWSYGPSKQVKALMIELGLKPIEEPSYKGGPVVVTAQVDCEKGPKLTLDLGGGHTLSWPGGESTGVLMDDKTCLFFLKGVDTPDYPTDWTMGSFMMRFPMLFDYNHGHPTISFFPEKK